MMTLAVFARSLTVSCLALGVAGASAQTASVYYVCPGNVFTNTITQKEADARGCKAREAQQPTTIAGPKPRPVQGAAASGSKADKVEAAEQRARDSDARHILEAELRRADEQLDNLRREYNNGEPERRGDENRNAQRYLDRVAELKAAIARQEADIAALKRELAKLPS
jgi:predicted RNase H-like nuclease (RuvC/YqgF family)